MPSDRNAAHIWDMLEYSRAAVGFVDGLRFDQYMADRKTQLAVERAIEIVGEAARRLSDEFKRQHTDVPWRSIIGQRNVLAHEYGEIKHERLWLIVTEHIPTLITKLELLIPDLPEG